MMCDSSDSMFYRHGFLASKVDTMTSRDYWNNLASTFNANNIDPLNRSTLLPLAMHDDDFGVAYRVDIDEENEAISGHWDVVPAHQIR